MDEQTGAPTPTQTPPVINEGPATLAQQIKAKHPEYEHIPDATLEAVAIAHNPEYAQLPRTHVSPQEAIAAMHQANASMGLENKKPTPLSETMTGVGGGAATEAGNMAKGALSLIPGAGYVVPGAGPWNAVKNIVSDTAGELGQAYDSAKQGNVGMAIHHAASSIPIVGPTVRDISEEYGRTGDAPHAIGRGLVAAGSMFLPGMAKGAGRAAEAVGETSLGTKVADAAATKGGEMVAKAITPIGGAKKANFAKMANQVGETVATDPELGAVTRTGTHENIKAARAEAADQLDSLADDRLIGKPIWKQPIVDALKAKLNDLTQANPNAFAGQVGGEAADLPSGYARARAQQLQSGIDTLNKLGPNIDYAQLRKIRADFDLVAKPGYTAVPSDMLTAHANKGSSAGAADVAGAIRETLAAADPATAKVNAKYSMMAKADDVLEAFKLYEQTRPRAGRTMFASAAGMLGGGPIGAMILPVADLALRSGPNAQLVAGRMFGQLAEMLRKGDATGAAKIAGKLRIAAGAGAAGETPAQPMSVSGLDIKGGG